MGCVLVAAALLLCSMALTGELYTNGKSKCTL
jgi:hypothetical protein